MRKLLLIPVLMATTWAMAQSDQSTSQSQSQMGKGTANQVSIQGCLSGSNGSYTLTDKSGNTFQLASGTADLSSHVGQQVQITGSSAPSSTDMTKGTGTSGTSGTSASGTTGAGSSNNQASQVSVDTVSKVSDTCSPSR